MTWEIVGVILIVSRVIFILTKKGEMNMDSITKTGHVLGMRMKNKRVPLRQSVPSSGQRIRESEEAVLAYYQWYEHYAKGQMKKIIEHRKSNKANNSSRYVGRII